MPFATQKAVDGHDVWRRRACWLLPVSALDGSGAGVGVQTPLASTSSRPRSPPEVLSW